MGARCPYLLSVDDELITVEHGTRAQTCEVTPGGRFTHTETPRDFGAQCREKESFPLFVRAVVPNRGRDDSEALWIQTAGNLPARHLLEVDHLLHGRRIASTQLRGPPRDEPSGVE